MSWTYNNTLLLWYSSTKWGENLSNYMMCKKRLALLLKKSRGWFRWCTSGWSCWRETRIPLLILHLTLGFPHFVNSYFKVHFCTSSQKEQQGCCLLFLPDMVMVFTSTLWCFKVWWKMKYLSTIRSITCFSNFWRFYI